MAIYLAKRRQYFTQEKKRKEKQSETIALLTHIDRGPSWYTATSEVKLNASPAATVIVSVVEPFAPTLHLKTPRSQNRYFLYTLMGNPEMESNTNLVSVDVKSITGEL